MRFFEHQDQARRATRKLVAGFVLAVLATVAGVHTALALGWLVLRALFGGDLPFPAYFFSVNVGVTLLLVLGGWWIETSALHAGAAQRLAHRAGAREARPGPSHAEQRLCNVVDEIAIAAAMPRPQAMVLPRVQGINAFATGWHEDDAVVAVTQGALEKLTREELQGMVAHECIRTSNSFEGHKFKSLSKWTRAATRLSRGDAAKRVLAVTERSHSFRQPA